MKQWRGKSPLPPPPTNTTLIISMTSFGLGDWGVDGGKGERGGRGISEFLPTVYTKPPLFVISVPVSSLYLKEKSKSLMLKIMSFKTYGFLYNATQRLILNRCLFLFLFLFGGSMFKRAILILIHCEEVKQFIYCYNIAKLNVITIK